MLMLIYQPAIHGTARDDYNQLAGIFKGKKNTIIDSSEFEATSNNKTKETETSKVKYTNKL